METSIKQILTRELVGKQILVYKFYSERYDHIALSSKENIGVLTYALVNSYYATIVDLYLGRTSIVSNGLIVLKLEDGNKIDIEFNQLLDLKEKED
jgi:hypothetical protein